LVDFLRRRPGGLGERAALHRAADILERLAAGPAVQSREPASVVEQPSDEELLAGLRHLYANQTAADMGAKDDLRTARAVLARWGNPPKEVNQ
jgi:hypothetical protein